MSNPEAFPASSLPEEKRQPRQSRLVKAALACQRLGRFDVTLSNVSLTGIGGQGPHALQIGERMQVNMTGPAAILGQVRLCPDSRLRIQADSESDKIYMAASHTYNLST